MQNKRTGNDNKSSAKNSSRETMSYRDIFDQSLYHETMCNEAMYGDTSDLPYSSVSENTDDVPHSRRSPS